MPSRVRQDGREAWQRRHGDASVGAVDPQRRGSSARAGGRSRPASAAVVRTDSAPEPAPAAGTEPSLANRRQGKLERRPATPRNDRLAQRTAVRERKAAVRNARQAAIQRRAEELAAARAAAQEDSALDELIVEVQDKLYQKRENIARSFIELFDKNKDGSVDRQEIAATIEELLNKKVEPEQIDGVVARTDTDGDGKIDLNEFIAVLKINDKQTRDIIRNAAGSAPATRPHSYSLRDNDAAIPRAQVERAAGNWLAKRQQELGDAGGIAHIIRRNMLGGGSVRDAVTPPVGRPPKPVGLLEIRANLAQRRLAEQQAEVDRIEHGGEYERAQRDTAALKKSRFDARVRIAQANRQAETDRSSRLAEKADKRYAARVAAKRFQREEWEAQAQVRDFYSCGFHGAQQVEPDAHPSEVRRKAPLHTPAIESQFQGGRRSRQNPFWTARGDNPERGPSPYVGVVGGRPETPPKPATFAWS